MRLHAPFSQWRFRLSPWYDFIVIIASALAAFFTWHVGNVQLSADAATYLNYAQDLANGTLDPNLFWRTPGYPVWLILTGYTQSHSPIGILYVQTLFAFLIPLLIQATLKPYSKPIAFYAAMVAIISLAPYRLQLLLYPDQIQIFLPLLLSWLVVLYAKHKNLFLLVICYAVVAVLSFFRPTMVSFIPLLLWLIGLPGMPKRKIHVRAHQVMIAAIIIGHLSFVFFAHSFRDPHRASSFAGSQLFFNIYMHSGDRDSFSSTNGPSTAIFREKLIDFLDNEQSTPLFMEGLKQSTPKEFYDALYAPYLKRPLALVDRIMQHPNEYYYWTLFAFINWGIGNEGDAMIRNVTFEQISNHPHVLWRVFVENGSAYFWGPTFRWKRASLSNEKIIQTNVLGFLFEKSAPLPTELIADGTLPANHDGNPELLERLNSFWFHIHQLIIRTTTLIHVIGGLWLGFFILRHRHQLLADSAWRTDAIIAAFCISSTLLQALPLAFLPAPELRYQSSTLPAIILSAFFLIYMIKTTRTNVNLYALRLT